MLLIIIHHVVSYLYYEYSNAATCMLPIYLTQQFGYLGTRLFFFLSGYGMVCSLRKNMVNVLYVKKKCNSIFLPYALSWLVYLCFLLLLDRSLLQVDLWQKFMLFSTPRGVLWFYNVIVVLYIVVLVLFRVSRTEKRNAFIVLILTLVYMPVANRSGLSGCWYNSVVCFPLGMLCAVYKPIVEKNAFRLGVV